MSNILHKESFSSEIKAPKRESLCLVCNKKFIVGDKSVIQGKYKFHKKCHEKMSFCYGCCQHTYYNEKCFSCIDNKRCVFCECEYKQSIKCSLCHRETPLQALYYRNTYCKKCLGELISFGEISTMCCGIDLTYRKDYYTCPLGIRHVISIKTCKKCKLDYI
jgi:hypothetical protein